MKIKLLKSTNCDGERVKVGSVVDASDKDGRFLVAIGYAETYEVPKRGRPQKAPVNRMDEVSEARDASE